MIVGSMACGMPMMPRISSSQSRVSRFMSMVRRRVRDVRDMHAAVDAAGQVPDAPGVDVAEHQVAGLGLLAGAGDVVQDPLTLGPEK